MSRVVMVAKWLPLPADDGGKLRTLAVLRGLVQRADVALFGFDDGTADVAALAAMGVEVHSRPRPAGPVAIGRGLAMTGTLSAGRFYDGGLAAELRDAAAGADSVVVEYLQMAPYVRRIVGPRLVLDLHNIESSLVATYADVRGGAVGRMAQVEVALLRRQERAALRRFADVAVVSATDLERLGPRAAHAVVCPNGCDDRPQLAPTGEPVVVFTALMGWAPNADAAQWTAREVWPLVRDAVPGALLQLVGRDPGPEVRALAGPGVEVTGTVPDVLPYLAGAAVALAPLRMGGGSRLKILEALAAGRPVVATSQGVEGLEDLVGEGVLVADAPAGLADHIVGLLREPSLAAELGRVGRQAVRARYSWEATLRPLLDLAVPPAQG